MKSSKLCTLAFSAFTFAGVIIPPPNGPYGVDLQIIEVVDQSRAVSNGTKLIDRGIMLSAFNPTTEAVNCILSTAPYMPNQTANIVAETFGLSAAAYQSLELSLCQPNITSIDPTHFPLVLFSPAWGTSRLLYSALAQSLASYGFVVVTIDHPGDADVVEYPDGSLVFLDVPDPENVTSAAVPEVLTRVQDVAFVLGQIYARCSKPSFLPIDTTAGVVVMGHSLGGATAAALMLNNTRVIGGIDLDGELVGPVIRQGLKNPFLIFGSEQNSNPPMPSWVTFQQRTHDWDLELELLQSTHYTFSDLPVLADLVLGNPLPTAVTTELGTISGVRAFEIVSQYVMAFLKLVLRCEPSALLQRPNKLYPEVKFLY